MTLRIVLSACVRAFRHSVSVDTHVIMTRKKTCINSKGLSRVMAADLCTDSRVEMAQQNQSDQESDSESSLLHNDSETEEITQPETVKILIVGLGNPDRQRTRHSVGMQFVDRVANRLGASWTREMFKKTGGFTATVELDNKVQIHILKPRVPMNLNGTSVAKSARFYSIDPENVYLIHDELDKPVGKSNLKEGGSASGHNGVKSVMNSLKSDVMPRLRIGVDRPANKEDVVSYVLEKFTLEEYRVIRGVIDESIQQLFDHIGSKYGVELNIESRKYTRQDSDYDSEDELKFRFSKGHKFKGDQRGYGGYKGDRRDFRSRNDRRDFQYRDDRRDFQYRDDRRDFQYRDDRRDFRYGNDQSERNFRFRDDQSERDFRYKKNRYMDDRSDYRNKEEHFGQRDRDDFKSFRRDFHSKEDVVDKRRNPVYNNDE